MINAPRWARKEYMKMIVWDKRIGAKRESEEV